MTSRAIASKLHSLLPDDFGWRKNWLRHYVIAVLSVAVALSTNLLLYPLLQGTPAALFYVAVMVSSWAGGLRPGLLTTGLSTFALHYFFVEPRYSLGLNGLSTVVQLSVFAMAAVLISTLNESRLRAKRQADVNLKAWRESEAQLTRLAEANVIGIFAAHSNGLLTEANDAFLKTVGYTREDLLAGRIRWMEMSPPEYQEICERSQQKLRATGICPPFEQEYLRKDGSRVPILLGLVMQDEQTINGFVLDRSEFKRNEAERQQVETALRESEEKLRLATESAKLGMWYWDIETNELVWNDQAKLLFGLPIDTPMSMQIFLEAVHPDDRPLIQTIVSDLETGPVHTENEYRTQWTDGTIRWILARGNSDYDANGTLISTRGVLMDITDRKQVGERLCQSEALYRALTELSPQLVFMSRPDGYITYCNQWGLEFTGKTFETLKGHGWAQYIHPDYQEQIYNVWLAAIRGEADYELEVPFRRADGVYRWLYTRALPVTDELGTVTYWLGVAIDITERKQIAEERERLLQQEKRAREEAEQANRIKDEFLAVLSHELRSPLNPILGWTKLLQSRPFTPERTAQALATIERNAKLQSQLIEDLLDVSRILQGKMVLNVCPVNLATTIEAAIETVRLAAEAKGIQIHTSLDAAMGTVAGDAARLQQMVWNLLTNAVKFTPQGGRVEVRLSCRDGSAQIQVQDTGKGISPEFLPHVFDCFRQEDGATTRKFGGLGLGLALVHHLTEQHGGAVAVESAGEGQGATFTICLPLQPLLLETDPERPSAPANFDLSNLKILAIDDEADMRELLLAILEEHGAQVRVVASAVEAISLLEQWQPDLLISDIGMPDVDGYMLLRQVRSRSPNQGGLVPAIALTAYAGEIDQQQAIAVGFQRHLAKPVEPEQLVEVIHAVIQANAPPHAWEHA